jgi:hypothetical protein
MIEYVKMKPLQLLYRIGMIEETNKTLYSE